jgi:hypothetical protein
MEVLLPSQKVLGVISYSIMTMETYATSHITTERDVSTYTSLNAFNYGVQQLDSFSNVVAIANASTHR